MKALDEINKTLKAGKYHLTGKVCPGLHLELLSNEPKSSCRYLSLAKDGDLQRTGAGGDFIEAGISYIRADSSIVKNGEVDYLPRTASPKRKALFLDRDGVIIRDTNYPGRISDVVFMPEIIPILEMFIDKGFDLIVVTNQSGVARGKYSIEDVGATTEFIYKYYRDHGINFLKTYFCPYHLDGVVEEFKRVSGYRKPEPGMILKACEEFEIDVSKSFMIGDKETDKINLSWLRSYTFGRDSSDFKTVVDLYSHLKKII